MAKKKNKKQNSNKGRVDRLDNQIKNNDNNDSNVENGSVNYGSDLVESDQEIIDGTEELELTNISELTFDDVRLADIDSLDTSFLEGRVNKKKIIKDTDYKSSSKKNKKNKKRKKSNLLVKFVFVIIIVLGCFFIIDYIGIFKSKVKVVTKEVTKEVTKVVVDDNYLFLGDSITDFYDLDHYYKDLPVVNSGISGNTTDDILDNMKERVYQYNPSKVFILIGTNDLIHDKSVEEVSDNIQKIIDEIQENRPYCKIYLESIYPINNTDDDKIDNNMVNKRNNNDIKKINEKLVEIAKSEKITYIDMYSLLKDEDDNLKLEYTKEGLHMSDQGYDVITKELMKYIK